MKINFIQHYILIPAIILSTCLISTIAQRFPIQVNTMITPPYSLKLSDYVESGYDRIQLTINPLDQNLSGYRIKLKLVIESFDGRISIQTDPNYLPSPVFLTGGLTEMLTSYDVSDLFDISHLIFSGLSKNQYISNGQLPEGYYRIGFVALDYNRAAAGNEVAVSNYGFAMAGLFLNDPPILNLPQNTQKVQLFEPQYILFQWTPRHQGSPNSAFSASYIFRLYEVWNDYTDPNVIASTQLPIFETETNQPRFQYGIAEPMLIPGKKYAWRVQVTEPENRDLFRNHGFSEAFIFQYGEECKVPIELAGEAVNGPGMELNWTGATGHTDYTVQYRVAGGGNNWYEESSLLDNIRIYDLQPSARYEVQVMAQCGNFSSAYSDILTLDMPAEPEQQFSCGAQVNLPQITNHEPLPNLNAGSRFTAGGFQCKVLESTGSNGVFSGKCLVTVPFYLDAKVLHTFQNISINNDYQMWAGKLVAVKDSARDAEFMAALEDQEWVNEPEYTNEELALIFNALDIISVEEPIESIEVNEDEDLVITYEDGTTRTINCPCQYPMIIADNEGNQYLVDEGGNVQEVTPELVAAALAESGATTAQVNNVDSVIALLPTVRFAPTDDMKYGYDSLKYEALRNQYTTQQIREQDYIVPFKAVATSDPDNIKALIPASDVINPTAISFMANQIPITGTATGEANNRKLSVTALSPGDVVPLEVYYNLEDTAGNTYQELLGKVNLAGYDKAIHNLNIVPVIINNVQSEAISGQISQYINDIYAQAAIEWHVTVTPTLEVEDCLDEQQRFDNTDQDDRMDYTEAMKAVYHALKDRDDYNRDDVYVFLIGNETVESNITGYMPFKGQFGFVFTANINEQEESPEHVIAHEIAHGAFNLRHTFSNENTYFMSENTSDNLMDYSGMTASNLNKYQWDYIHDPESMLFVWLEDEGEGESDYLYDVNRFFNWIVENKANDVSFKLEDWLGPNGDGTVYDVPLESSFNGKDFTVYIEMSNNGSVKLSNNSKRVNFDPEKWLHTGFYISFTIKDEEKEAFRIWSYTYDDFILLLARLGYALLDTEIQSIQNTYVAALNNAGTDCDELDVIFETIPDFIMKNQEIITTIVLTNALEALSSCSMSATFGTDEEKAVLNVINEFGLRNPDELLKLLRKSTSDGNTIFSDLYNNIEDIGGDDNFSAFIILIYKYWLQSNYKTLAVQDILPYTSIKKFGFYFDNFDIESENGYLTNKVLDDEGEEIGTPYDLYDAIILSKVDLADNELKIPSQELPFFYFKAYDDKNHNSNVCTGTELTFDVLTTFSGIGNLAKLKYLRHLTKLGKLKVLLGSLEFTSGTANIILKYTDNCGGTVFCQKLSTYLFWIEVGSMGTDAFTVSMIKKSASEALDECYMLQNVQEDITDNLCEVAKGIELVGKYDWALIRKYFIYIQKVTGRTVPANQVDELKKALKNKEFTKLTPAEYDVHSRAYNDTQRNKMISDWEINTGQTWPTYSEDYIIDGVVKARKGQRYQLHHIIEKQYGGPHEWWNSHPARFPDEHQGGIHAADSPSRELFK